MKRIVARTLTYDAAIGRIEPGQTYTLEDDKAERWITSGIASPAPSRTDPQPPQPPPPPPPQPEPEGEPEEEEGEGEDDSGDDADTKDTAHRLHDAGDSERAIAQKMGISRTRVHSLLAR